MRTHKVPNSWSLTLLIVLFWGSWFPGTFLIPYHCHLWSYFHTTILSSWACEGSICCLFLFCSFCQCDWEICCLGFIISIHWSNCRAMYMNPSNYSLWWKICQAQGWPCSFKGRLLEVKSLIGLNSDWPQTVQTLKCYALGCHYDRSTPLPPHKHSCANYCCYDSCSSSNCRGQLIFL